MSQENKNQIQHFLDWKDLGNWSDVEPGNKTYTANNPLCGDEITLHCKEDEKGILILSMKGEACSVCLASAGILYHKKENWSLQSLNVYLSRIDFFLNDKGSLGDDSQEEVLFWEILKLNPGRHRCALLPFTALKKAF